MRRAASALERGSRREALPKPHGGAAIHSWASRLAAHDVLQPGGVVGGDENFDRSPSRSLRHHAPPARRARSACLSFRTLRPRSASRQERLAVPTSPATFIRGRGSRGTRAGGRAGGGGGIGSKGPGYNNNIFTELLATGFCCVQEQSTLNRTWLLPFPCNTRQPPRVVLACSCLLLAVRRA